MKSNSLRRDLRPLVEKVISKHFPNQIKIFELYYEDMIRELERGKNILEYNEKEAEFEAGPSIIEILEFMSVLAGTFTAILEFINLRNQRRIKKEEDLELKRKVEEEEDQDLELKRMWENGLQQAGLSEKQSVEITEEHLEDLKKLLKR